MPRASSPKSSPRKPRANQGGALSSPLQVATSHPPISPASASAADPAFAAFAADPTAAAPASVSVVLYLPEISRPGTPRDSLISPARDASASRRKSRASSLATTPSASSPQRDGLQVPSVSIALGPGRRSPPGSLSEEVQLRALKQQLGSELHLLKQGLVPPQRQPLLAVRALQWQEDTLAMERRALLQQERSAHQMQQRGSNGATRFGEAPQPTPAGHAASLSASPRRRSIEVARPPHGGAPPRDTTRGSVTDKAAAQRKHIAKDPAAATTAAAQQRPEGKQLNDAAARRAPPLTAAQRKAKIRAIAAQERAAAARRHLLLSVVAALLQAFARGMLARRALARVRAQDRTAQQEAAEAEARALTLAGVMFEAPNGREPLPRTVHTSATSAATVIQRQAKCYLRYAPAQEPSGTLQPHVSSLQTRACPGTPWSKTR